MWKKKKNIRKMAFNTETVLMKENLFTLFYRGGGDEKKKVEGYGIGMTLAHKIIHLHDGNIAVHSEQGKGTLFIVEIPHI